MPTTSSHSLPYPDDTDPADVPADLGALAEALDTKLDAIAPGQITGPTSTSATNETNVSGTVTVTKYVQGLIVLSGSVYTRNFKNPIGHLTTLPAGYRPAIAQRFPIIAMGPLTMPTTGNYTAPYSGSRFLIAARINTDGTILSETPSGWTNIADGQTLGVFFDGITFLAA